MKMHEASAKYNILISTLALRLKKHGIKKGRGYNYSEEEINQVIYKHHSQIHRKYVPVLFTPIALEIIDFYHIEKENSVRNISDKLKIDGQQVQRVLNYYFEHKELIIESKINHQ